MARLPTLTVAEGFGLTFVRDGGRTSELRVFAGRVTNLFFKRQEES